MDQIIYAPAPEPAGAVRRGEASSAEVVEAHPARIGEVNPNSGAGGGRRSENVMEGRRETAAGLVALLFACAAAAAQGVPRGMKGVTREARALPYSEVRALTKFLPRTRELLLMSKADAVGTCGLFVRYSFRGARPRVPEARRRDDCGGPGATPDAGRRPKVRLKR